MKLVKAVLGICAFLAVAIPVSASDVSNFGGATGGVQYGMPSQQDLQLLQMQGGMNYRHEEDALKNNRFQQDANQQYQEYSEYGREGNPANKDVVSDYSPNNGYMQEGLPYEASRSLPQPLYVSPSDTPRVLSPYANASPSPYRCHCVQKDPHSSYRSNERRHQALSYSSRALFSQPLLPSPCCIRFH